MADMTKKQLDAYKEKEGSYHKSDPRHAMNSELTGPSVTIVMPMPKPRPKRKPKKMAKGGYANCGASVARKKKK